MTHILAIDQGTTSTRAILFDKDMRILKRSLTAPVRRPLRRLELIDEIRRSAT